MCGEYVQDQNVVQVSNEVADEMSNHMLMIFWDFRYVFKTTVFTSEN